MPDVVTVRAGSKMVVEAIVAGKPAPFCKWKQGNEDVLTSDRLSVVKTLTSCTLMIKHVTRKDSGYYSLSAENSTGKANQILRVTVMGQFPLFWGFKLILDVLLILCSINKMWYIGVVLNAVIFQTKSSGLHSFKL